MISGVCAHSKTQAAELGACVHTAWNTLLTGLSCVSKTAIVCIVDVAKALARQVCFCKVSSKGSVHNPSRSEDSSVKGNFLTRRGFSENACLAGVHELGHHAEKTFWFGANQHSSGSHAKPQS